MPTKSHCIALLDENLNFSAFDNNLACVLSLEELLQAEESHVARISRKFHMDLLAFLKFLKNEQLSTYSNVEDLYEYIDYIIQQETFYQYTNEDTKKANPGKSIEKSKFLGTGNFEKKKKRIIDYLTDEELTSISDLINPNSGVNYEIKKNSMFYEICGDSLVNIYIEVKSYLDKKLQILLYIKFTTNENNPDCTEDDCDSRLSSNLSKESCDMQPDNALENQPYSKSKSFKKKNTKNKDLNNNDDDSLEMHNGEANLNSSDSGEDDALINKEMKVFSKITKKINEEKSFKNALTLKKLQTINKKTNDGDTIGNTSGESDHSPNTVFFSRNQKKLNSTSKEDAARLILPDGKKVNYLKRKKSIHFKEDQERKNRELGDSMDRSYDEELNDHVSIYKDSKPTPECKIESDISDTNLNEENMNQSVNLYSSSHFTKACNLVQMSKLSNSKPRNVKYYLHYLRGWADNETKEYAENSLDCDHINYTEGEFLLSPDSKQYSKLDLDSETKNDFHSDEIALEKILTGKPLNISNKDA